MGTIGVGILKDDTAMDIRDEWMDAFRRTGSAKKATAAVRVACREEFADDDDGPVALLALALTLWKNGCLDAATLKRALKVIDRDEGLTAWEAEGPRALKARQRVYEKVRAQLVSRQPPTKEGTFKPRVPKFVETPLQLGDVFSVPVLSRGVETGGRGYFHVIAMKKQKDAVNPAVRLLDVPIDADSEMVNFAKAKQVGVRSFESPRGANTRFYALELWAWNARGWRRSSLTIHANVAVTFTPPAHTLRTYYAGQNWATLGENIIPSLDPTTWPTPQDVFHRARETPPSQIAALRPWIDGIIAKSGERSAWIVAVAAGLINMCGDYTRALAMLDVAAAIDPALDHALTRGHALLGLGREKEAERLFAEELQRVTREGTTWGVSYTRKRVDECRAEVAARRAGSPISPSANFYFDVSDGN